MIAADTNKVAMAVCENSCPMDNLAMLAVNKVRLLFSIYILTASKGYQVETHFDKHCKNA